MSDMNKYINAYVDNAVGMLHENLATILQLKTQLKISNELIAEKDVVIGSLRSELEVSKSSNIDMASMERESTRLRELNTTISKKVEHLDTALSQIAQMKNEIRSRDEKIFLLEEKLKVSKKKINTKKLAPVLEETIPEDKVAEDDF